MISMKYSITQSQYLHRKRSNEAISAANNPAAPVTPKNVLKTISSTVNLQTNLNTEMMEDQLLAQMIITTQTLANNTEMLEDQLLAQYNENEELNDSDRVALNDCIDPDSSALALLSDEDDKENIENVEIVTKNANTVEQRTPLNTSKQLVRTMREREHHHSPVTASNFFSMGPFFGLPTQVKKLIKTFKNIDDLYGKRPQFQFIF